MGAVSCRVSVCVRRRERELENVSRGLVDVWIISLCPPRLQSHCSTARWGDRTAADVASPRPSTAAFGAAVAALLLALAVFTRTPATMRSNIPALHPSFTL